MKTTKCSCDLGFHVVRLGKRSTKAHSKYKGCKLVGNASTITRKGQVTIPSAIRRKLGLSEGDTVVFREDGGQIIIEPATRAVTATAGVFRAFVHGGTLTAEALRDNAGEAIADESGRRADG